jgi:drug/metabolite transporter (DMT)-like permease
MATLSLLLVTAVWGWTFVLVKDAVGEVGPFGFLAVRFFLASLFALPFWPRRKSAWRPAALLGVFLFAGYFFQTWGLRYTTAQKSGLITGFSVVLVPIFARLLGERVRLGGWAGAALATAGVALLALAGNEPLGPTSFGDFLTVLCAIFFAWYIALLAHYAKGEKASALLLGQLSVVFLLSLLGAAAFGEVRWPISGKVWVSLLITGVFASALAYYVLAWAEARAGATKTAVILAMEPVFAGFFGWLLLGETLSPWQILGAVLVVGGILLASVVDRALAGPDNP